MSVEELKRAVTALSAAEQNELTAFLFHLRHRNDPAYVARSERPGPDEDPSSWVTLEEFENQLGNR
ncbi:hypothetical protein BH20VER1_BH20VER1_25010 [soil metagenome]